MSRPRVEDIEVPASASDGDVPTVDSGVLVYAAPTGGGSLDDLTDVDTASTPPTDGQTLLFDDADSTWKPGDAPPATNGLPTGGTDGQVLTKLSSTDYDTDWETPTGGSAPVTIDDPTTFDTAYGSGTGTSWEMNGHGTTLPSGLTGTNLSTSTFVEDCGALAVTIPAAAGDNCRLVGGAISGSTWVAVAKITARKPRPAGTVNWGMYVRDTGTGKLISLAQAGDPVFGLFKWTNATTFSSGSTTASLGVNDAPSYFRIRKNSSTSYDCAVSWDGVTWKSLFLAQDFSAFLAAVNEVGFYETVNGSLVDSFACHWLRWR